MATYIGLLRKEDVSCYGVDFPDFPGCVTGAETLDLAYVRAHEVLALHVRSMVEDGDPIPEPGPLSEVMANPENKDALPFLVHVVVPKGKAVRVNVTFDEGLLEEIDAYAKAQGKTRAGFLADVAREALRRSA